MNYTDIETAFAAGEAQSFLLWCSSQQRTYQLVRLGWATLNTTCRNEWLSLLGDEWSGLDDVGLYLSDWKALIPRETCDLMMDEAERERLASLPPRVVIYRGCYEKNRRGFSWTLDRETAEGFPSLNRYRRFGDTPLLGTIEIPRNRCVALKLDRDESEVIVHPAALTKAKFEPIAATTLDEFKGRAA